MADADREAEGVPASGQAGDDLAKVRSELRRMGYLHHGFGRYLLQDALKPHRPWRALLTLTIKVAIAVGGLQAVAAALGLAAANGTFEASPFDVIPLFLHLLVPAVAVAPSVPFEGDVEL